MSYRPEKKIEIIDQIRTNLIKKGLNPELAKFLSRKWVLKT
jgi:hypothetical protein